MGQPVLVPAWKLIRKRRFAAAITLLQSRSDLYEGDFEYYLMLGTACLYAGDVGYAATYFSRARNIRVRDTRLLLGQAAIYLRRGDTVRAVEYYLEIQEYEPRNKTAGRALEFLRSIHDDFDTIRRWVDSGKIERFYPPIGINPLIAHCAFFLVIACLTGVFFFTGGLTAINGRMYNHKMSSRADISDVALTADESVNAQKTDAVQGAFRYTLSVQQINEAYQKAQDYFNDYHDSAAQLELNRIINSNASEAVRKKAELFMAYLQEPSFDTLRDNYSCTDVTKDPYLYENCWISWIGRITNVASDAGESASKYAFQCDLIVGDAGLQRVEGVVPLCFEKVPSPEIDSDKPVRVLAKVTLDGGRMILQGKSVYQNVSDLLDIRK